MAGSKKTLLKCAFLCGRGKLTFFSCCSCEVNLGMEKMKSRKKEGRKRGARLPEDLEDDDVTVLSDSRVKVRTLAVPYHDFRLL